MFANIQTSLNNYVQKVSSVFGIELAQVIEVLVSEAQVASVKGKPKLTPAASSTSQETCVHHMLSGANAGNPCGGKVDTSSTTGKYCKKHVKYETAPPKTRGKKSTKEAAPATTGEATGSKTAQRKNMIPKNKYGNYEHAPTGFVFSKELKIIGKQVGDKVIKIKPSDIPVANEYKFAVDTGCVETEEQESDELDQDEEDIDDVEQEDEEEEEDEENDE